MYYFIPVWLDPFVSMWLELKVEKEGHLSPRLFQISGLLFIAAALCYAIPYMRRKITFGDAFLFGMLTPFCIWIALVIAKQFVKTS